MNKIIIAVVAAFFTFSFYSFMFSGAKSAAENVKEKTSITSVDRYCKQVKGECDL